MADHDSPAPTAAGIPYNLRTRGPNASPPPPADAAAAAAAAGSSAASEGSRGADDRPADEGKAADAAGGEQDLRAMFANMQSQMDALRDENVRLRQGQPPPQL